MKKIEIMCHGILALYAFCLYYGISAVQSLAWTSHEVLAIVISWGVVVTLMTGSITYLTGVSFILLGACLHRMTPSEKEGRRESIVEVLGRFFSWAGCTSPRDVLSAGTRGGVVSAALVVSFCLALALVEMLSIILIPIGISMILLLLISHWERDVIFLPRA